MPNVFTIWRFPALLLLLAGLALLSGDNAAASEPDPYAPILRGITIEPGEVDVTHGRVPFVARLDVEYGLGQFNGGNLYLPDLRERWWLEEIPVPELSDTTHGVYVVYGSIPGYVLPQLYTAEINLPYYDSRGFPQYAEYGGADENPLPTGGAQGVLVKNSGPVDQQAPQLLSVSFLESTVDVSESDASVTVRVAARDDVAGIDRIEIWLRNIDAPSGIESFLEFGPEDRVSGHLVDGVWEEKLIFPAHFPQGTCRRGGVSLIDRAGRASTWFTALNPQDVEIINTGEEDLVPIVTAFTCDPSPVNVSQGNQTVIFTLQLAHDPHGIRSGEIDLRLATEPWSDFVINFDETHRLPDTASGEAVYQVPWQFSRYTPPGEYTVHLEIKDLLMEIPYFTAPVPPWGESLPEGSCESLTVLNTGTVDTTPPVLKTLTITPNPVDISAGPAEVTVHLELEDDLSGVLDGHLRFVNQREHHIIVGGDYLYLRDFANTGTPQAAVFEVSRTVPKGTSAGDWPAYLILKDAAGNRSVYQRMHPYLPSLFPEGTDPYLHVTRNGTGLSMDSFDNWLVKTGRHRLAGLTQLPASTALLGGIPNLVNYALALTDEDGATFANLPRPFLLQDGDQEYWAFCYNRRIAAADVEYQVYVTEDFAGWDRSGLQVEEFGSPVANPDGLTEKVTVRIKEPVAANPVPQKYLQLVVQPAEQ